MRFVALCYDVIRSDAMVPIVEAIVLIVENFLAAKIFSTINPIVKIVTRWTKQAFSCSKFLSPGGQLWANTAFEGSQFYSIGVPKFYRWVNVISVYAYNDLG